MNQMEEKPVLYHTMNALLEYFGEQILNFWLVAPEFDRGGLEFLHGLLPKSGLQTYYGYDASPLERMVHVTRNLEDEDFILRVNGINFCVDTAAASTNITLAQVSGYDCVRFPDDFPSLFTSDVYRVGALRRLYSNRQNVERKFLIHPKYYFFSSEGFRCEIAQPSMAKYSDGYLAAVRERYRSAMDAKRIEVDSSKAIRAGDTIQFHYELASTFIKDSRLVLDLACGSGFGAKLLSGVVGRIIGVDNDPEIIEQANNLYCTNESRPSVIAEDDVNVEFLTADILDLPFEDNSVDAVVAFEIIEHISPDALLNEISRVLKPGGLMCLSTPQNSLGHTPTTSDHLREFSLDEIRDIVGQSFSLKEIIGIKQGSIFFHDDPVGNNTFIVAWKPMSRVHIAH